MNKRLYFLKKEGIKRIIRVTVKCDDTNRTTDSEDI